MHATELSNAIATAIEAHITWKVRLRQAIITGTSDITPAVACRDDACAFGKWLHGPTIDAQTRSGIPFQVIRRLHAEFHQSAGQVLTHALKGDRAGAEEIMEGDYEPRSKKLITGLNKWRDEVD